MISFLTPPGKTQKPLVLSDNVWKDLEIGLLAREFRALPLSAAQIKSYLTHLETDTEVLSWRQENLKLLLENPEFLTALLTTGADWTLLREGAPSPSLPPLQRVLRRLGELEAWVRVVNTLSMAFEQGPEDYSGAWENLRLLTGKTTIDPDFQNLQETLPKLRQGIQGIRGVSIGINLHL